VDVNARHTIRSNLISVCVTLARTKQHVSGIRQSLYLLLPFFSSIYRSGAWSLLGWHVQYE